MRETHPHARLVIAPRELLRTMEVVHLCRKAGFSVTTRTKLQNEAPQDEDIVILDTIGELGKVYSIGDVVFVGGSLVPARTCSTSRTPTRSSRTATPA